jgi:DNA repair protein RadC
MSKDYATLSDQELLGKLIGVRQARRLYGGTLQPLFSDASAPAKLLAARELIKRLLSEEIRRGCALTSPGAVRDYLKLLLGDRDHEVFVCLWLDAQHRVIKTEEAFRGTLTQTSVYPREIVKSALAANAAAVLFAHNHPSGVAQPSQADELLTRNLKEALALVEVKVLDHFIVAGKQAISFAERGLL